MSADAHRIIDLADNASAIAWDAAGDATWRHPANTVSEPADWLKYADAARAAAQEHDAARIAYFAAEQAARARAAELATKKETEP